MPSGLAIPWSLEHIGEKRLEQLEVQTLRDLCVERRIEVAPKAHGKTCVAKLLEWKKNEQAESKGAHHKVEGAQEKRKAVEPGHGLEKPKAEAKGKGKVEGATGKKGNETQKGETREAELRRMEVQALRDLCAAHNIEIADKAHAKTCVSKLLAWEARHQKAKPQAQEAKTGAEKTVGEATKADGVEWRRGVPAEFSGRVDTLVVTEAAGAGVAQVQLRWGKQVIGGLHEWRLLKESWEKRYPVQYSEQHCPHEDFRIRSAVHKNFADTCWHKLSTTALSSLWSRAGLGKMQDEWLENYRVDVFGNVVGRRARAKALCAFEVDHIFPWARGGRTVADNLFALYHGANNFKRSKILQCVEEPRAAAAEGGEGTRAWVLQQGLSGPQFVALFKYIRSPPGPLPRTRKTATSMEGRLKKWLDEPWGKECIPGDLNQAYPGWRDVQDGAKLWQILVSFDEREQEVIQGVPDVLVTCQKQRDKQNALLCHLRAEGGKIKEPYCGPFRQQLKSLGFVWDGIRLSWNKCLRFPGDGTNLKELEKQLVAIEDRIRHAAHQIDAGFGLNVKFARVGAWS